MDETGATHILLDPTSPVDARVLYVTGFGRGVYKSSDGGRTWALKNSGITQEQPFAWRLARSSNGTLYVVMARRSEDGSYRQSGRWRAVPFDGRRRTLAACFSCPRERMDQTDLRSIPIRPIDSISLPGPGRRELTGTAEEYFFRKMEARLGNRSSIRIVIFTTSRSIPKIPVLYAAGFESSAWRSADRGSHWARIPGFNFKWGQRVIPDPLHHDEVYITTFGGSVWHGAINGEPRPVDIDTPVLEPGTIAEEMRDQSAPVAVWNGPGRRIGSSSWRGHNVAAKDATQPGAFGTLAVRAKKHASGARIARRTFEISGHRLPYTHLRFDPLGKRRRALA